MESRQSIFTRNNTFTCKSYHMNRDKTKTYDNIPLTFILHSGSVTGVLSGQYNQWSFESDSPAFLKLLPSGRLRRSGLNHFHLSTQIAELVRCIHRTAEDLGYAMEEMY
jgi:hypothetical protein